jgi:hypothetical protein
MALHTSCNIDTNRWIGRQWTVTKLVEQNGRELLRLSIAVAQAGIDLYNCTPWTIKMKSPEVAPNL